MLTQIKQNGIEVGLRIKVEILKAAEQEGENSVGED